MVRAWRKIHKKGGNELGPKNCIVLEPYTAWVRRRASEYLMPYNYPRPTPLVVAGPSTLPNQGVIDDPDDYAKGRAKHSSANYGNKGSRLQLGQEKGKVSIATRAREKNRNKGKSKQGLVVSRQSKTRQDIASRAYVSHLNMRIRVVVVRLTRG
ncbi:hypothetical protein KIW84_064772 [Lathyrus oleraceus]|uniref:Uncharacterized protein n=1 Tax=Pisum sativum TaxID=3888 RepID=A0A9D5A6L2_PEA|nr:hypothetical protein KIW84_064772 [Pisum sativum]